MMDPLCCEVPALVFSLLASIACIIGIISLSLTGKFGGGILRKIGNVAFFDFPLKRY